MSNFPVVQYGVPKTTVGKVYEKPLIWKEHTMRFPQVILESVTHGGDISCKQCSSCHGCR